MTEISNSQTGQKKDNFLKQLNECSIDRFKELATEKGLLTIYGVREAESFLQSEFALAINDIIPVPIVDIRIVSIDFQV